MRLELGRMGKIINTMLHDVRAAIINKDRKQIDKILSMDHKVNILETSVLEYLSKLRREELTEKQSNDHQALMTAAINLEKLADVIKEDLGEIALHFIEQDHPASEITRNLFQKYYNDVRLSLDDAVKAISENDQLAAEKVINRKADIKRYENELLSRKSSRLGTEEEDYLQTARLEISLMDKLYRIYSHTRGIAKVVLPAAIIEDD